MRTRDLSFRSAIAMSLVVLCWGCVPDHAIKIYVEDAGGDPIDGFSAQVDERGERTRSVMKKIPFGATCTHGQIDVEATTLIFVTKTGYHPGMAILEPLPG